jgi:DNA polymerase delta subunit 1
MGFVQGRHEETYLSALDRAVKGTLGDKRAAAGPALVRIEPVMKSNIYGFHGHQKALFLRLSVRLPAFIAACKRVFKEGFHVQGLGNVSCSQTFESNIPFPLRFMIDAQIQGGSWMELPKASYTMRGFSSKTSSCQIEVDIWYALYPCPLYAVLIGT